MAKLQGNLLIRLLLAIFYNLGVKSCLNRLNSQGVEGMLKAYHRALRVCHLHGPSYLAAAGRCMTACSAVGCVKA